MMRSRLIEVVHLLLLVIVKQMYAQPTAVITPRGYNASLDPESSFTFQCDATGADSVQWSVDGVVASRDDLRDRGISESGIITVDEATRSMRRTLSIVKNINNSIINITCIASSFSPIGINSSEPVFFKIQGLLDAPSNLILSGADSQFIRRLSWDEPFSLDIADVDPDISHYKVCYSLINVTVEKSQCKRVLNRTDYVFPYVSVPLHFTVSAVNIVGEGNSTSVLHEAINCSATKDPESIINIQSRVSFSGPSGASPKAVFLFQQWLKDSEVVCFFVYKIESFPLSAVNTRDHGIQIPLIVNYSRTRVQLSLTVDTELTVNEEYHAIISAVDANGEANFNETIEFDTYDVQLVNGTVLTGGVEVSCTFADGSQAQSCILTICRMENGFEESCWNITISRAESTKGQQVANLQPGVYTITKVAEVESNGQLTIHRKRNILELRVIEPPPLTTISGSPSLISTVLISIGSTVAVVLLVFVIVVVAVCTRKKVLQRQRINPQDLWE